MRLINAENMDYAEMAELLETIAITGLTDVEGILREWIEKQPTAYSLDDVLKQLGYIPEFRINGREPTEHEYTVFELAMKRAAAIVNGGE